MTPLFLFKNVVVNKCKEKELIDEVIKKYNVTLSSEKIRQIKKEKEDKDNSCVAMVISKEIVKVDKDKNETDKTEETLGIDGDKVEVVDDNLKKLLKTPMNDRNF